MTLFSYEIFDAVARQGSFNKAAQQLHLTPSAISHAIAVMEEELGFALFNRGKNGVSMTSYGASLYPSIRAVLNSDEALKQSIARLNGLEKGKVKLGAFNSVCASLLPGLLKSFAAQYPQIEIEVYQGTYDDVKEWLRTGQVDIAFLSSTCKEEFNLTELFREPLLCIVPQDWPEPQGGVMTPALMNGQSFVVQCDATDAEMRQFLKKYKISTERRCHVIDDQSNIAMVEAGLGISIMPQMLLRDCKAAVKVYPIEPGSTAWWVWPCSARPPWLPPWSRCSTTSWTTAVSWSCPCDLFSITQSGRCGKHRPLLHKTKTFAAGAKVSARRCFTLPEISGIMKDRTEQNAKGRGFYGDCGVRFQPTAGRTGCTADQGLHSGRKTEERRQAAH